MELVILARHGESEFSVRGAMNGDPEVAVRLTPAGQAQARRLGELVAGDAIDLAVTSTMQRARETAAIALAGITVPRLELPELNDMRVGSFEGRLLTEYREWSGAHGPLDAAPGGGESRAAVASRFARAYRHILERPEACALVVAHGLPIRYALDALESRVPRPFVDQVPYAQPFRVAAADLARAVDLLYRWSLEPAWIR